MESKEEGQLKEYTDQIGVLTGWSFQTAGGIVSSPVLVNSMIYFGSKDGNFYAVDRNKRSEVWSFDTGNPIRCQAAVLDNTIFFSSSEVYYALDSATGEMQWSYDLKTDPMYTRRMDQWDYHDSSPVIDQGVVYFGSTTGKVLGLDVATGEVVWEHETYRHIAVRSTPLIRDGILYYGDWLGSFQAVDIKTKEVLWQNKYSIGFQNSFAAKDDILIIGGRDTAIHGLKTATGEEVWSYRDPDGSWITGDPEIIDDIVYFPTSDAKKVYAMNIYDGTIVSTYPVYKNSFSRAIIDNGLLYVTSGDAYSNPGTGKLQVYRLDRPYMSLWEVEVITGGIFTSPVLADGMIYFGSEDGCLYAKAIPNLK